MRLMTLQEQRMMRQMVMAHQQLTSIRNGKEDLNLHVYYDNNGFVVAMFECYGLPRVMPMVRNLMPIKIYVKEYRSIVNMYSLKIFHPSQVQE